ncbi:MAG: 23S rRNA (adenine(2030)-N(6))-methyltransferase RlmJ [Alphaproteobacteria bacterium]
MLSYRHGFHAGNHADVLKHAVAVFLVRYLQQKPGGVLFVDTHAGAGLYDLAAPMAAKTAEWEEGVARVLDVAASGVSAAPPPHPPRRGSDGSPPSPPPPGGEGELGGSPPSSLSAPGDGEGRGEVGDRPVPALVADWLALVRARNPGGALTVYPGSAALFAALRRKQDRVALYDLHPTDHAALAALMRRESRVAVTKADGFAALDALLPPPERRALVLVDPSYEIKSDYEAAVAALAGACRRFPTGVYALWLPVIERARTEAATRAVAATGLRKVFRLDLCVVPDGAQRGLTGSRLLVVNPPWTLPDAAAEALPWLARALGARGPVDSGWLVPE